MILSSGQRCPASEAINKQSRNTKRKGANLMASMKSKFSNFPPASGLYNPDEERDSCGVAMVATLTGNDTHEIVSQGLTALRNLEHRGASGAEPDSGDGAGILIRVPDAYFQAVVDFKLPAANAYATGIAFVARGADVKSDIAKIAEQEGLDVLGWREVPINSQPLGKTALSVMPDFHQVFVAGKNG
jgi:glutamate synthase (NADPH/NADH) large chain